MKPVRPFCYMFFSFFGPDRAQRRPSIKSGTWNIPEHAGTFRNIPEHPGT